MEVLPKKTRHFMPFSLEVKPTHRFLKAKVLVYSKNQENGAVTCFPA